MPRFLSSRPDSRLIPLPWETPLAEWPAEHLVALPRGISRHVVRFIKVGNDVYAAKEVIESAAVHEYRMLQEAAPGGFGAVQHVEHLTDVRAGHGGARQLRPDAAVQQGPAQGGDGGVVPGRVGKRGTVHRGVHGAPHYPERWSGRPRGHSVPEYSQDRPGADLSP